jgi:tRNA(His) 5'-end guanylyltransferase
MSHLKLKDRIDSYQESSDYKLLARVPLIICINGRSFAKASALLEKPYDVKLAECMHSTMLRLCSEIEGTLFGYHFNDEIVIVTRNDQGPETSPWYDNKLQKICSITSSIATGHFDDCASSIKLQLTGDPIFYSQVFAVPNIMEATNTIVFKQQNNFLTSIQLACLYELLKKYEKNTIKEMLSGLSMDEKIDLLKQECDVDFNDYPTSFRRGAACYKIPKIVNETIKNKWFINEELPIFTKDQSFLSNIFKNGADIFRKESF